MTDSKIIGLLITGFLAVMGTIIGGIVQGYMETNLAEKDFQSKLIMKALESDDVDQRIQSLTFLVDAHLLSPDMTKGLKEVLGKPGGIPQFLPVGAAKPLSSRDSLINQYPTLDGKDVALVGFRVRHGDVIDGLAPIYSEVSKTLELLKEYEGEWVGGDGGDETVLKKPGYVVTGFDVHRGVYFGSTDVVHLTVYWNKLTSKGINISSLQTSTRLGSGNNAKLNDEPKLFRSNDTAFISDFIATTSGHTGGDTFIGNINTKQTVVVSN